MHRRTTYRVRRGCGWRRHRRSRDGGAGIDAFFARSTRHYRISARASFAARRLAAATRNALRRHRWRAAVRAMLAALGAGRCRHIRASARVRASAAKRRANVKTQTPKTAHSVRACFVVRSGMANAGISGCTPSGVMALNVRCVATAGMRVNVARLPFSHDISVIAAAAAGMLAATTRIAAALYRIALVLSARSNIISALCSDARRENLNAWRRPGDSFASRLPYGGCVAGGRHWRRQFVTRRLPFYRCVI